MGNYSKLLKEYKKQGNFDEGKMWESVDVLDAVILSKLEEREPELYWEFMRDQHEIFCGPHFDEKFARWEMARMCHKDARGNIHKGEHWADSDVMTVYNKYKSKLPAGSTVWDFAVAITANWHDKIGDYLDWFGDKAEERVIEDAVRFYFLDDDAPEGKIWRYVRAMH